ncbi:hypothetical protein vseg_007420 [Gypsophila vaccaria]
MNALHQKQQDYADKIRIYLQNQSLDQAEIRRLTGAKYTRALQRV